MTDLRKNFDCVIGVHIRRGEYISWNDGRYFFTDEVYIKKMEAIESQMKLEGKQPAFLFHLTKPLIKVFFRI